MTSAERCTASGLKVLIGIFAGGAVGVCANRTGYARSKRAAKARAVIGLGKVYLNGVGIGCWVSGMG